MMVNINKLKGKVKERNSSIAKLAKEIGIDPSTLYRKLQSGGESISIGEANIIVHKLSLTVEEANAIFFAS